MTKTRVRAEDVELSTLEERNNRNLAWGHPFGAISLVVFQPGLLQFGGEKKGNERKHSRHTSDEGFQSETPAARSSAMRSHEDHGCVPTPGPR